MKYGDVNGDYCAVQPLYSHDYSMQFCLLHAKRQFPDDHDDCVCLRHLLSVSFSDERLQLSQMG